jgi:hypothetical protein
MQDIPIAFGGLCFTGTTSTTEMHFKVSKKVDILARHEGLQRSDSPVKRRVNDRLGP